MRYSYAIILALAGTAASFAQSFLARSSFTAAATALSPLSGDKVSLVDSGAGFSFQYDFRVNRYLAAEAGVQKAWPRDVTSCSRFGCTFERASATFTPFGLRGILPLNHDRIHITAGFGGAYVFRANTDRFDAEQWLAQASIGFSVGLTREGSMRIGPSVRFYSDLGRPTQRWAATSLEFSWAPRF
jgi:hypothetical protein